MFEKEAEEYANKKLCSERICYNHCNYNSPKHHRCGEWHRIYECAKDNAEFGYDKAVERCNMNREELVKQGLMLSEEDIIKFSHGYSSRIPYPKNKLEFKEAIAEAYLSGTELMADFYEAGLFLKGGIKI